MGNYPEHDKLSTIQEEHDAVRDFMEAVTSAGYQLCRNEDAGFRSGIRGEHIEPRWMPHDWRNVVSAHFAIDEDELERERRAMLAAISSSPLLRVKAEEEK